MTDVIPPWGPQGQIIHERTYSRTLPDGTREGWHDTVSRVVKGNLALVYGDPSGWSPEVQRECGRLYELMAQFKVIPAGRHLWASGVPGRQYLQNCFSAGWTERFADHFTFTLLRLAEGGGVGANYASKHLQQYPAVKRELKVHIVCDPAHADYPAMVEAGVISREYSHEWSGAFPVGDSREGWADALGDLLDTFYRDDVRHANRVYDVSRVRPRGAPLRSSGGTASGPDPFARLLLGVGDIMSRRAGGRVNPVDAMEIDHEIGSCVVAGGNRRSARMSLLPWDDPHIDAFLECKRDTGKHWTTNISVEVDARFFEALNSRDERAEGTLRRVAAGMLENGEPGIWNSALSGVGELRGTYATNPCSEITLEPWEPCNLGHVNMDAFHDDSEGMEEAHRLMVRFLMRATFGDVNDPRQLEVMRRNRRVGVGHFGVQGWLVKSGISFSEAIAHPYVTGTLDRMRTATREEARLYAFRLRIPEPIKVTTIAPTGTIAKLAGRTEGIHPVYARHFLRRVRFSTVNPAEVEQVAKLAAKGHPVEPCQYAANTVVVEFPTRETLIAELIDMGHTEEEAEWLVQSSDELSVREMLAFQAMYQREFTDNAISFTVNVVPGRDTIESLARDLRDFLPRLKGTTVFPDMSRPQSPYERITKEQYEASAVKAVGDSVDEECTTGACPVK